MTTVFYVLAKVGWFLLNPGNVLFLFLLIILGFTAIRSRGKMRVSALIGVGVLVFTAFVPIGGYGMRLLENRFPSPTETPSSVTGIVVLGGAANPVLTRTRGQDNFGDSVERLIEGAALARKYPKARLILTAGAGRLSHPEDFEAPIMKRLIEQLGVASSRIEIEDRSRNTYQNAVFSRDKAAPKLGETWILVTSARHMPRSVGTFRKVGWPVVPYPVDYSTRGTEAPAITFNFLGNLLTLNGFTYEAAGLAAYWATGKSENLFPGPLSP